MPVTSAPETKLTLTLTKHVNAAPECVFDALLDPKLVCRWLGPRSMVESCEVLELEPHVGGRYRVRMRRRPDAPHGPGMMVVTGVYQKIERPNRLAFSWTWDHENYETRVAIELRPHAGGTEVTLTHEGFAAAERMEGHRLGWTACMQQLADLF